MRMCAISICIAEIIYLYTMMTTMTMIVIYVTFVMVINCAEQRVNEKIEHKMKKSSKKKLKNYENNNMQ